jgi:hypothetical protein
MVIGKIAFKMAHKKEFPLYIPVFTSEVKTDRATYGAVGWGR